MADSKTTGVFGAPKRSTRWVKAAVAGGGAATGRLETDGAYISLDLIDLGLSRPGVLTSKFHALFLSDLSVATQVQTKLRQSALIDPRKVGGDIQTKNASGHDLAITSICAQMPWQGKIDGELVVLALRSEAMLTALLDLNERLSAALPKSGGQPPPPGETEDEDEAGHESLLAAAAGAVTGKLASTFLKKIGYTAAVEVARLLKAQDGTYQTRLRVPVSEVPFEPGHYVMLPAGKADGAAVELDFGGGRLVPALKINGRTVRGRDYALVRVTATDRHQNIEDVPAVGDAWVSLQRVLQSGGQPDEALNAFRRVVAISPYLIGGDRQRLQLQAEQMVESVRPYLAATSPGGQESVLDNPLTKLAFRTLKDAWNSGALDGLPGAIRKTMAGKPEARAAAPATPPVSNAPAEPTAAVAAPAPAPVTAPANRFETALAFCFKWEGGYSDHVSDRGGKTNYGVTEQVFHSWLESRGEAARPVKEITHEEVRAIYWSDYWLAARCDRLKRQLDLLMFDASVNHGPGGAAKLLQRTLNAMGETLKVDGAIGGQTFAAIAKYETKAICAQYLAQREALFRRIVEKDASQGVFLKGWLNRVKDLAAATGEGGSHSDYEALGAEIVPENTPFAEYVD